MKENILLTEFNTLHQTPPFNLIKDEDYLPAFIKALENAKEEIHNIIHDKSEPTFENTIVKMEYAGELLSTISSIFFNINHAETNEKIQSIAREVSPLLTEYSNDIWLNETLFFKVKSVYDNKTKFSLDTEDLKLLNDTYKAFTRKGALLTGDNKKRYREISTELSKLTLEFGENILAETNNFSLHITNKHELSGLPENIISAAEETSKTEGKEGWIFTLHYPSYVPFMKYADNRDLRKKMFIAYSSRGNQNNKHDNKNIVKNIVNLRLEKAQLLGYKNHAEYVLEERMAQSPQKVNSFLNELLENSLPFAKKEMDELNEFAKKSGFNEDIERWDFAYFSEKLKAEKFEFSEEMTKPYFMLENVEKGIFELAQLLYNISFKENSEIPVYHPEVKAFEVFDENKEYLAVLYIDYFPRKGKQGGAWMTNYGEQYVKNNFDIRPLVSLVCNFSRPGKDTPSLLTYNEVRTFLHEFGHGLHGILSKTKYKSLSGTNVYRDFVELPSQILENWGAEKEWINKIARHYKTGELIPESLVNKITSSINFQSGYQSVRQLSFGINDMAWHTLTSSYNGDIIEFEKESMSTTELFKEVKGTCFSTSFSHIFAGGYAAGYYGYKWAEVLDADAFSVFKKNGIFDKKTAESFKENILTKGGTKHPMDLYKAFRGQEPTIDALLERSGLR